MPNVAQRTQVSLALAAVILVCAAGCGTTKLKAATDQLLLSDAVDRSVNSIDFRPLTNRKVFLDTDYIRSVKGLGFVNSDYIISSLRQQVVAAGCLLQDKREDADLIIEARVGTLGSDAYQVSYGIPASNALSTAASLLPETPPVPTIPEISFGRRESQEASAKIAAFAYDRISRKAVWQSGVSRSETDARDTWVLGVGPFEGGTVREINRLAGKKIRFGSKEAQTTSPSVPFERPLVNYSAQVRFQDGYPVLSGEEPAALLAVPANTIEVEPGSKIEQASLEEAVK